MSSAFDTKVLDCELYRVGRPPDPWEWVDWIYAGPDATFSGRYGRFRVLYASSQRYGALVETLAQFRPDPHILAAYASMETQQDDATTAPPGDVPLSWCRGRVMTKGVVTERLGPFVRIGGTRSLATLRSALADRLVHYRIDDLDGAAIRLSAPRQFTQEISSFIEPLQDDEAEEAFGGINYLSRLGDDIENWAIFERQRMHARSPVLTVERSALDPDGADLQAALQLLGLKLV